MKKIGITITELSVIILIYGLLKLIFYYSYFGITITNFITISEIGLLISEDLLIIIPLCSICIIGWVWVVKSAEKEWEARGPKRFPLHPINFSFYIVIFLMMSVFMYWISFHRIYPKSTYLYSGISVFIILVIINYKRFQILSENSTILTLVLVVLFVTASLIYSTAFQLKQTFKGKYDNTTLITKDSTIYISSDTLVYMGKTQNYIFFHRMMRRTTEVIPVSEIKFFRIHTLTKEQMKKNNVVHL